MTVHENQLLNLDVTKAHVMLDWHARLTLDETIEFTVDWYKEALNAPDMFAFSLNQIKEFCEK